MATDVRLGRLKFRCSKQEKGKEERTTQWAVTLCFLKNSRASQKSLMKFSQGIKIIILLWCSLQTARKKLSRPHCRENFPQSNVKTALDSERVFVPIYWKDRDQIWVLTGTETITVEMSCVSASLYCTADTGHMKQERESEEHEMMWHLTPGKLQGRILEDLCIHQLFMIPCLLKTIRNLEVSAWVAGILGFTAP